MLLFISCFLARFLHEQTIRRMLYVVVLVQFGLDVFTSHYLCSHAIFALCQCCTLIALFVFRRSGNFHLSIDFFPSVEMPKRTRGGGLSRDTKGATKKRNARLVLEASQSQEDREERLDIERNRSQIRRDKQVLTMTESKIMR